MQMHYNDKAYSNRAYVWVENPQCFKETTSMKNMYLKHFWRIIYVQN